MLVRLCICLYQWHTVSQYKCCCHCWFHFTFWPPNWCTYWSLQCHQHLGVALPSSHHINCFSWGSLLVPSMLNPMCPIAAYHCPHNQLQSHWSHRLWSWYCPSILLMPDQTLYLHCNIWVKNIITGDILHSCLCYRLYRDWNYLIWHVTTYPTRYPHPPSNFLMILSYARMISCIATHQIMEIKVYILRDIWWLSRHCFNMRSGI